MGDVYIMYWGGGGGSLVVDAYDQCVVVMYGIICVRFYCMVFGGNGGDYIYILVYYVWE